VLSIRDVFRGVATSGGSRCEPLHFSFWGGTAVHPNLRDRVAYVAATCFAFVLYLIAPLTSAAQQHPAPSIPELKSRAESGDFSAQAQLSQFLLDKDPSVLGYDSALSWLRDSASRNNFHSQFLLGYLYEHGQGVPHDCAQAARYYEAAAVQGHHASQNNLAGLYQHGLGVRRNFSKAFELYLAAARQNDPVAQSNLAAMYYDGQGTPRNFTEAARWFRAAADSGDPVGQHDLGVLYYKGQGVPLDYGVAAHWVALSARQGHPYAASDLAYLYENGQGVPLDYAAAYTWYSRAAASGDARAGAHLKSLSQIMSRKQLDEANSLVSSQTTQAYSHYASPPPPSLALLPNP
jgi:uncharacterized protein